MLNIVFLTQIFSTLYMTGLIWFVQVVHYPLHGEVGPTEFQRYQELHMQWTSFVVMPPMLLELITTLYLVNTPFPNAPTWVWWVGLGLLGLVWGSTGLLQVPAHTALLQDFSIENHQKLVMTNWIRTVFWTARSLLLMWTLSLLLSK